MSEIETKLKKIISVIFLIDQNQINNQSSNENIKEWDSLKHLSLVLAIEEEFNIRFSNDETLQLTSFKNIVEILKNNHKI
tara:strand:- start:383 stop:622 length:240 start_codon:yes stop_codon:yes gene_type:complete